MNLIEIIKNAVRLLFGQSKVIASLKTRISELEAVNEGLRNSHAMDTVSLRKAAEAAAADLKAAKARENDLAGQLTVLDDAGRELLAAVNDNADLPIYDEAYNLLAPSGVPAVSEYPEGMTPEEIAQVEAECDDAPQVPTNLVAETVSTEAEAPTGIGTGDYTEEREQTGTVEEIHAEAVALREAGLLPVLDAESEAVAVAEAPEIAVSDATTEPSYDTNPESNPRSRSGDNIDAAGKEPVLRQFGVGSRANIQQG